MPDPDDYRERHAIVQRAKEALVIFKHADIYEEYLQSLYESFPHELYWIFKRL